MKRPARIVAVVAAVIAIGLVLLLTLPLLFRDRIARRVKAEVNRSVNASVDWRDVGLGFFRNFPNLTLTLDSLSTVGVGPFQGDTLAAVRHLRVVLDLGSVLGYLTSGHQLVVRAVELDQPRLHLLKLENGAANWDITKKTTPAQPRAPAKPLSVRLHRFAIQRAAVTVDDRQAKLRASLAGFDQSLGGDFSQRLVTIHTTAHADTASISFAGITYLDRVALDLASDVHADLAAKTYTLRNTQLSLNDLRLDFAGTARSLGQRTALDITFKAPTTSFRSILSLVPAVHAHDFDKVQTSGTVSVDGWVKGEYGENAFPSFAIDTKVDDAAFKYADLPLPARAISMGLSFDNPGGSADSTVVTLDHFHVVLGRNPVDAHAVLRTPISDADVDLRVVGGVDLADLRRTIKLPGIEQLAGTVAANAAVRTRMSALRAKQYDKVAASGNVDVAGVTVKGKSLPHPLTIRNASLALTPQRAQLKSFTGTVGSSDIQATGSLDNLIGFVLQSDTLRGTATVRSQHFDLDEWRSGKEMQIIEVPPKIDFALDAAVAKLTYAKLTMSDARAKLRMANQRATLQSFQTNTLGGQIGVSGWYQTTDSVKPTFDVTLKMGKVDIPSAFQALATVQALAPVAKYASGTVTTDVHVAGALGKNMMPLFPGLNGAGTLQTSQLAIHDFPALTKLASITKLQFLDNPTLQPLATSFQIQNGRLSVKPFDVKIGGVTMNVAGSNGLDQTLQYTLALKVPRSMLGGAANQAVGELVSKAGKAGVDIAAAPEIPLAVQIGGTVTKPTVAVDVSTLTSSVAKTAQQAVTQKASAEAAKLVADAEQRAARIRQDAQSLADRVKQEGNRQADSLQAKAGTNPLLQAAAKPAADRLRQQANDKAATIVQQANQRADSLVAAAKAQAARIPPGP